MFESIGKWLGDNSSWLGPVVEFGTGAFQQINNDRTQGRYMDYLAERERQNYQDSVDQLNFYNQQIEAQNQAAASRAAAARQTEANRMKASKKANRSMQNTYKDILAMYAPFRQTAETLLPQKTQTYQNALGLQNTMLEFLKGPQQMAKLNQGGPAWNVNVPLPESVRIR